MSLLWYLNVFPIQYVVIKAENGTLAVPYNYQPYLLNYIVCLLLNTKACNVHYSSVLNTQRVKQGFLNYG